MGIATKEKLKVLNDKEKELKEKLVKQIFISKASDKEVVRVLCFLLNHWRKIK